VLLEHVFILTGLLILSAFICWKYGGEDRGGGEKKVGGR
jgi:hypothetical protein